MYNRAVPAKRRRSFFAIQTVDTDGVDDELDVEDIEEIADQQSNGYPNVSSTTTLEDTNTSLTALSADETLHASLSNANQGLVVDTSNILLEINEETREKQLCNSEDTNQEETTLKQNRTLADEHAETSLKRKQNPQNSDLMVQKKTSHSPPHSVQLHNPTSFDQENPANSHHSNPEASGAKPSQNHVDPAPADVTASCDWDYPRADTESSIHGHESYSRRSLANVSSAGLPELSLHEDLHDPPNVRDMISTLNVRNPNNMVAGNQYALESISLDNGAYSGPSFSMPSSAGVRRSADDEEEPNNVQLNQPREAQPLNEHYDTEERMLHKREYT